MALTLAMTPLVVIAQPRDRDEGEFRILQARYGIARRNVDVTRRLQALARNQQSFRIDDDSFGVDPDEGRVKSPRIYARGADGDVLDGFRPVGVRSALKFACPAASSGLRWAPSSAPSMATRYKLQRVPHAPICAAGEAPSSSLPRPVLYPNRL